jgi:transcriptional regulator with XRE-family HTH domain
VTLRHVTSRVKVYATRKSALGATTSRHVTERMNVEELLELPLRKRIVAVRGDLSHDSLGKALGTSRYTVIRWENGTTKTISDDYVQKLAAFTGLPEDVFRDGHVEEEVDNRMLLMALEQLDRKLDTFDLGGRLASVESELRNLRAVVERSER